MADLIRVKDYDGVAVYMDPTSGKFQARVGNSDLTRKTLPDLEREIRKRAGKKWRPIPAMGQYGGESFLVVDFVASKYHGSIPDRLRCADGDLINIAYKYDEALAAEMLQHREQEMLMSERRRKLTDRLVAIKVQDFVPLDQSDG